MVDNKYTGVGYEPPFETPSDKDFMSAHIESLKDELEQLRTHAENAESEHNSVVYLYDELSEKYSQLRARNTELEEMLELQEDQLSEFKVENIKYREEIARLRKAAIAYRELCSCYRVGRRPSESLFNGIEFANKVLEASNG